MAVCSAVERFDTCRLLVFGLGATPRRHFAVLQWPVLVRSELLHRHKSVDKPRFLLAGAVAQSVRSLGNVLNVEGFVLHFFAGTKHFLLVLRKVQTGCVVHPASCLMGSLSDVIDGNAAGA